MRRIVVSYEAIVAIGMVSIRVIRQVYDKLYMHLGIEVS